MTKRNRWIVPYLAAVIALFIRLWMSMMRVRIVSADGRSHPEDPRHARYLYAFWHEGLLSSASNTPQNSRAHQPAHRRRIHRPGLRAAGHRRHSRLDRPRRLPGAVGNDSRSGRNDPFGHYARWSARAAAGTQGGRRDGRLAKRPSDRARRHRLRQCVAISKLGPFALPRPGSTMVGVVGEPIVVPRDLDRGALQQWVQRRRGGTARAHAAG